MPAFFSDPVQVQLREGQLLRDGADEMRRPMCLPSAPMSFQPASTIQLTVRKWKGERSDSSDETPSRSLCHEFAWRRK